MDYYDSHEGRSPWASSPRQTRTSFEGHSRDVPEFSASQLSHSSREEDVGEQHETLSQATTSVSNGDGDFEDASGPPHRFNQEPSTQQPTQYSQYSQYQHQPQKQQQPHTQVQQQPQQQPGVEQPIARAQQQRPQPGGRPGSSSQANRPQYKLQAKVNGLERTGRKDPMIRFDIYTNLPNFRTTQFRDVRRSHSEFLKLQKHLFAANPEAMVPELPKSETPAGVGTDEDETRVKTNMQRWLNVVCSNEVLMRDEEVIRFVEGDPGYSPVFKRSPPATGARRKMLKQFAPPPDDTPELHEARPVVKSFYLTTMDASQKVEKLQRARRGMGNAENEFGTRLGAMMEQEPHPGLKNAYRKLGKTIQTVGDLHAAQATGEATLLGDPLQYHSNDAFIVKETLTNRHLLLRELHQAQQSTRSKLSAVDRLKSSTSVRKDKVDEAISALDEARGNEEFLYNKTQRVTHNLVNERRKWFARTAQDLRESIREYAVREIENERRCLATLEAVRPDVRGIDASGGLSRLGREAHPQARSKALVSSQGPKGDAWSGVPRRGEALTRSMSGSFVAPTPPPDEFEEPINGEGSATPGRSRAASGAGSLRGVPEEDDTDRVDAKNAASRLAQSTF